MSFILEPLHTDLNATTGENVRTPMGHGHVRSINYYWSQISLGRICNGNGDDSIGYFTNRESAGSFFDLGKSLPTEMTRQSKRKFSQS